MTDLTQFIKDYMSSLTQEGLAKNSKDSYEIDLCQYCQFLVDTYHISDWKDVTREHVEHFITYLTDSQSARTTISRKLSALRGFHKFLKLTQVITTNPMQTIVLPKKSKTLPVILSEEEMEKMLAVPNLTTEQGIRDKAILEVMYATGIRVSELCQLELSQVHLETGMMNVIGKGNKERIVLLGEEAIVALQHYYQSVRPNYDVYDTKYVFLNRRGKPFTRQGIWKWLKALALKAGIYKEVTPHTIRHSLATHLLARGMDLRMIQELLGHDHLVTTQIYTQVDMSKLIAEYDMAHPHAYKENN